jgi:hypothetical protein
MEDASPALLAAIAEALGTIGDVLAVDRLVDLVHHRSAESRYAAAGALNAISNVLGPKIGNLFCGECLARFVIKVDESRADSKTRYPACRVCGRAHEALRDIRRVVAVLDSGLEDDTVRVADGTVRVNWLSRRSLFDFDRVEIVNASDKDVESFCVQVGNDTNEHRRKLCRGAAVKISPGCDLRENTLRIVRDMFRQMNRRN